MVEQSDISIVTLLEQEQQAMMDEVAARGLF